MLTAPRLLFGAAPSQGTTPARARARARARAHARPLAGLLLLGAAVSSCTGTDNAGAATPTRVDSAGVSVVTHPDPAAPLPTWTVELDGALRLPGDFHQIVGLARLSDGTLVVANAGDRQLRYFDAEGSPRATAGGTGAGPGEFQHLTTLVRWDGDSILTHDLQLRRLTLFDDAGSLVRSFGFETTAEVPFAVPLGVLAEGTIVGTSFAQTPSTGPEAGRQRYPIPVVTFAADGTAATPTPVRLESDSWYQVIDGGFSVRVPPFATDDLVRVAPRHIVHASRLDGSVRWYRPDGVLVQIVRGATQPGRPLTAAMRTAEIDRLLSSQSTDVEAERRALESIEMPPALPALADLMVDRLGCLWIREYHPGAADAQPSGSGSGSGSTHTWRVVDPAGDLLARVTLPAALQPREIGEDYLFGVHRDALGVETPLLVALRRGE